MTPKKGTGAAMKPKRGQKSRSRGSVNATGGNRGFPLCGLPSLLSTNNRIAVYRDIDCVCDCAPTSLIER
jgi:hypothetical protein